MWQDEEKAVLPSHDCQRGSREREFSGRQILVGLFLGVPLVLMVLLPTFWRLEQVLREQVAAGTVTGKGGRVPPSGAGGAALPPFPSSAFVEQRGAAIAAGGDVYLYAVGSSSLVWMTWLDQVHLALLRLGYKVPIVPVEMKPRFYPKTVPQCDDSQYYEYLKTARFSRIGWSSWDFAYEGWEGCDNSTGVPFRDIVGHKIKCRHGPGCHYSENPLKSSLIAKDAAKSNITFLASWFNDYEQYWSHYKCFDGTPLHSEELVHISIHNLLRNVREIHSHNPQTWVVIMAKYTQAKGHVTDAWLRNVNSQMKEAMEKEPHTLFVDYEMAPDDLTKMYQVAHAGHPNCQGSKLMAHAALDRLFTGKVLERGVKMVDLQKNLFRGDCESMDTPTCLTSALCWADPEPSQCVPYSAGTVDFHTVCEGSVCEGDLGLLN